MPTPYRTTATGPRYRRARIVALAALLAFAPAVAAEERAEVDIGPFLQVGGNWSEENGNITGAGSIRAPWGGEIKLEAELSGETGAGTWRAAFAHPVLGEINVARGRVAASGLAFTHEVRLIGGSQVTLAMVMTPGDLTGTGEGTLRLGRVNFGQLAFRFADGTLSSTGETDVRLPGLAAPITMSVVVDGLAASASGRGLVKLGPFAFEADAAVSSRGVVSIAGTAEERIAGIGTVALSLAYADGAPSATGGARFTLGDVLFEDVAVEVDRKGSVSLARSTQVRIPGIGDTELALKYSKGKVAANGTQTIRIGPFAFAGSKISVSEQGVELAGNSAIAVPGVGTVRLSLAYDDGRVTASGKYAVKLGTLALGNASVTLDSDGNVGVAGRSNVSIPGIGSTELALSYGGGAISASGSKSIRLGSFAFDNTAIAVTSSGAVIVSKQASVNLPGIGSVDLTIAYAGGVLSASGRRNVSLGPFAFDDTAVAVSSNGTVTLAKQASVTIPGVGSTDLALSYAGGVLSASGSRDVRLGNLAFDNSTIAISSTGAVTVSKQANLTVPGIGSVNLALAYAGGVLSASGSKDIRLGSLAFDNTAIAVSSDGTIAASKQANLTVPGIGSVNLALAYAGGVLSASGSKNIQLGSFAFDNTAVDVSSTGAVTVSKQSNLTVPGIGLTEFALAYAGGVLSASGSKNIRLGSFAFDNTAIAISSDGTVTASKQASISLPGIGATDMTLTHAGGRLSANGTADIQLGQLLFSDVDVAIDSAGTATIGNTTRVVALPAIGSIGLTLAYSGGQVTASGRADITVEVLGVDVDFANVAVSVASTGSISLSASQSVRIAGFSYSVSISYANGHIDVDF